MVIERLSQKKNQAIKRGAWTREEDQKLITYIRKHGIWNWNLTAKFAGLSRTGKSCRLRWLNYLSPDVKRGDFTEKEVETIIKMYETLGSRWSLIAKKLQGRTDNDIKNYFNTRLKKHFVKNLVPRPQSPALESPSFEAIQENSHETESSQVDHNAAQDSNPEGTYHVQAASNEQATGSSLITASHFARHDARITQLRTDFSQMNMGDSQTTPLRIQHFTLENSCMEEQQVAGFRYSEFDLLLWSLEYPLSSSSCLYGDSYYETYLEEPISLFD